MISGVVGIPVVPFDERGEIDHSLLSSLVRRLCESGIRTLTINGNTGEFYTLTPEEREKVVVSARAGMSTDGFLVSGVGLDIGTARREAQRARDLGVDAVMIHQPVNPYLSGRGWVEYNVAVSEVVPETPVLPYLTSPLITSAEVDELVDRAPNVVGVKCSLPDLPQFGALQVNVRADIVWIAGLAESYAPGYWQLGARGFTSGLVNVAPGMSLAMLDALKAGDAQNIERAWALIRQFEELRARHRSAANVAVVKEAMAHHGLCSRRVRPPASTLSDAEREEVLEAMRGWKKEALLV
ncbi:dihydrodipicolinate synthase family protein [Nesterenkonia alba]|uniref:dihydrodipicolinate synthase family protein n=1 Tax=Nesterenkonia alba TaxID=515814 RepID=UPI001FDF7217|nr:dihydrodipicolinate synthase family protein [Nesterenkonia alba]